MHARPAPLLLTATDWLPQEERQFWAGQLQLERQQQAQALQRSVASYQAHLQQRLREEQRAEEERRRRARVRKGTLLLRQKVLPRRVRLSPALTAGAAAVTASTANAAAFAAGDGGVGFIRSFNTSLPALRR